MTSEQLALDLFGHQAARQAYISQHQTGQIRLPYTTADGRPKGSLIPAWRCCACGGIEPGEFVLQLNHGCCGPHAPWKPRCQNPPGRPRISRWDDHWIPPAENT